MNLQTMPTVLELDADAWALRINARWRASIESIFETGQLLIDAKGRLAHGEFGLMLESKLDFRPRQAQMLMSIAADKRLANPQYVAHLPPSWGTIYDITRLDDDALERGFREQIIRPDMERSDVALLRPRSEKDVHSEYTLQNSDASGSPVVDNPGPRGENLHQGLDTSSIPGTAGHNPQGEGTGAASVTNPEEHSASAPHVSPGASEAVMPGGGLAITHNRIEPSDSLDFFPTPPWATRALVECVFRHLGREGHCKYQTAWEAACGELHMAIPLRDYFRDVCASDIKDYGCGAHVYDFLTGTDSSAFDWIITNPPFNDSAEFVLKAIKLAGTGVAMFVRLSWLESVGRYEKIFRDHPPTVIAIFSERVPLHKGRWESDGGTMTAYIWLVWIKGAEPRAPFWIPPGQRETLTKPDDAKRFGRAPSPTQQPSPGNDSTEDAAA